MKIQCAGTRDTHRSSHYTADYSKTWPNPARTRCTHKVLFIASCSHFTRKNTRFRAPASSPQQTSCNTHAAITMRFATTAFKTPWNYNAQEHAKHIELAITLRTTPRLARTRRRHKLPFIASCSHFTRKNTRFRAPASSPQQTTCNTHAAITMRFATTASKIPHVTAMRKNMRCTSN